MECTAGMHWRDGGGQVSTSRNFYSHLNPNPYGKLHSASSPASHGALSPPPQCLHPRSTCYYIASSRTVPPPPQCMTAGLLLAFRPNDSSSAALSRTFSSALLYMKSFPERSSVSSMTLAQSAAVIALMPIVRIPALTRRRCLFSETAHRTAASSNLQRGLG